MSDLKPCPFCGGIGYLDFAGKNFTYFSCDGKPYDTGFFYTVKCEDCMCQIGIYDDAEQAVKEWNRRAE